MSYPEALLECDLHEVLGNQPPPDLRDRALVRLREQDRPSPRLPDAIAARHGRRPGWRGIAQAAGIAIVLGLIGWLLTRGHPLPATVIASGDADYRVSSTGVELRRGWLLLDQGAPVVAHGDTRIEVVNGRAVAGTELPDNESLYALAETLALEPTEKVMFTNTKRWITTGTLTLCLFSGHLIVNGQRIDGEAKTEAPQKDEQAEVDIPKADDIPGIKALLGKVKNVHVRTQDRGQNWSEPTVFAKSDDVEAIRKVFVDNLKAMSPFLSASSNAGAASEFELRLNETQHITVSVPRGSSWISILLPDENSETVVFYDVDRSLHDALNPWLQKVSNSQLPNADDIPGIKALITKATRAELRAMDDDYKWHGWLQARTVKDVETIRAAFADNLKAKATKIAGYDHLNNFRLVLADGRVIKAAVYTYGDLVDLTMPGQVGSTQYEVAPALRKTLEVWLDNAAKVDPLPLKDAAAMRELLARAENVVFRDDFTKDMPKAGTLAGTPIKQLIEVLWRDNLKEAADDEGTSRTVFAFTFNLPEDEKVVFEVCDNGWFAMKIAGAPDLVFRTLPPGVTEIIADVLEPHGKAVAPTPVGVLRSWAGPNSALKKARAEILTNEEQWKKTWAEHDPAAELPKIDFEREMVLAVFDGDSWNSRGFYVRELLAGDNGTTLIRVDEHSYQSMGEGDRVTPFGIFVITRTERTVTVEENVQGLIGKPPQWKALTARIQMFAELPTLDKVFARYKPTQTWTGAATRNTGLFMTATNDDEWREMWDKMIIADPQLPIIDWGKQMAVAVRGEILQGLGDFQLQYAGANANRTVLRLVTPTAQTAGGTPEYEPRYAIWVLPKPAGSLVVETPRYGRLDQPPTWLEEHVIKMH